MTALVAIEGLVKSFDGAPRPAIGGLSIRIEAGRMNGLVGPDGAGKTTLIRLIAGLLAPDSGQIAVDGLDPIENPEAVRDLVAYMPQRFGLYDDLTVLENLTLYARIRNVEGAERARVFERLLAFTGLGPFTRRLAGALSGGMKQKLGLACALIKVPKLLLLDEPSVGVDPISRRELWRMTRALIEEGIGVLWSTAYLDEAARCDEVALINEGQLLFAGPPDRLTAEMRGRTFLVRGLGPWRRRALDGALALPDITDALAESRDLRLVLAAGVAPPPIETLLGRGVVVPAEAAIEASQPRFEDAFIARLGRRGRAASPYDRPRGIEAGRVTVTASGLTRRFGGFTAARDIDFTIRSGEIYGLLGPNGAGKSTIFKMICGLMRPSAGRAAVASFDLSTAGPRARAHIGYMAQKFSLYGGLSVRQNLDFFAGIYGLGRRGPAVVGQMVAAFGLKPYLDEDAAALPLGFKQRLALACATLHDPEVLFLDEPTSGVDPLTRREFWQHINAMVKNGVTVVVTTHFMDEAEYCDRIGLIYRGRIVAEGPPDALRALAGPDATLEEAFIALIEAEDAKGEAA